MVSKKETKTEAVDSEYFKCLKQNNITLAKALTEERLTSKQLLEERIGLQRKLDASLLLNIRYETILSKLLAESKSTVPVCTALLSNIQQILKLCSDGVNLHKLIDRETKDKLLLPSNNSNRSISPVINKTHAVKPMVSGHVIFRPTINLLRLSETGHAELTRNIDSPLSTNIPETTTTQNENTTGQNLHPALYDLDLTDPELLTDTSNEAESIEPILNGRLEELEPVEEESEPELANDSSFMIREARVVIDPLSIIQTPIIKKHNTSSNEDPLEGPSTLLDDSGQFTSPTNVYVSKPRQARSHLFLVDRKRYLCVSDSDTSSDDEVKTKSLQHRNTSKRKFTNISKTKAKKSKLKNDKKNVPIHSSPLIDASCQPYVVLRRENLSSICDNSNSSFDDKASPMIEVDDQNVNTRPRRNKITGSFKELSLRCKLRRNK